MESTLEQLKLVEILGNFSFKLQNCLLMDQVQCPTT